MIQKITELDLAELRLAMRHLYTDKGQESAIQALYEILIAGQTLSEIIIEESTKSNE